MDENQRAAELNENRNKAQQETDVSFDDFKNAYYEEEEPQDDEIDEDEFEEMKENPPETPSFPYIIFFAACVKDLFDIIYTILLFIPILNLATSALIFLIWIFNIILAIIIWIWLANKPTFIKKQMIKDRKMIVTLILSAISESFPGINAIPTAAIDVYLVHRTETKYSKKTANALKKPKENTV